jgi:hypothetical protein
LREIIEITYAYDIIDNKTYYNKTLCQEFVDCSQCTSYEAYYQTLSHAFDQVKIDFIRYHDIFQTAQPSDAYTAAVVEIMRRYCAYLLDMIHIAYSGLPFEIEKM